MLGDSDPWGSSDDSSTLSHDDSHGSNNSEGQEGIWDAFKSIFTTTGDTAATVGSDIAAGNPTGSGGGGKSTAATAVDTGAAIINAILPSLVKGNQKPTVPLPPVALPWYKTPIGIGLIVVGAFVGYKALNKPKA